MTLKKKSKKKTVETVDAKQGTAHLFSCYTESRNIPAQLKRGSSVKIHDATLAHRIYTVLRKGDGDNVELFDGVRLITMTLEKADKKINTVSAKIIDHTLILPRKPILTVGISLLKRDNFEKAVYSAAQMGATTIVPIVTSKSRQRWSSSQEVHRLEKQIIAACEQSRNFSVPHLTEPMEIEKFITIYGGDHNIFFETDQTPLTKLQSTIKNVKNGVSMIVGPEGGFVPGEVEILKKCGAKGFTMTQTVLRSHEATCVGAAIISSFIYPGDTPEYDTDMDGKIKNELLENPIERNENIKKQMEADAQDDHDEDEDEE